MTIDQDSQAYIGAPIAPNEQLLPAVSFDIAFGKIALEKGLTYDVDHDAITNAMQVAGLTDEQIPDIQIRIKPTGEAGGYAGEAGTYEANGSTVGRINLFCKNGINGIYTTTVTHESTHIKDGLDIGDEAFLSRRQIVMRKLAATAFAASIMYGLMKLGHDTTPSESSVLMADLFLVHALNIEYMTRKHEVRAYDSEEKVERVNILQITNTATNEPVLPPPHKETPKTIAIAVARTLVPDYRQ